ncbi:MAG: hypothetical protein ACFBZ8_00970 [Opitutales bacterium]
MFSQEKVPLRSLKIVAYVFLVVGWLCVADFFISLFFGHLSINLGVLNILIGEGLLNFSSRCRMWALVFLWFGLVTALVVIGIALLGVDEPQLHIFGQKVADLHLWQLALIGAGLWLICFWQYRVLTHPGIRARFKEAQGTNLLAPDPKPGSAS